MNIVDIEVTRQPLSLLKPYRIANKTFDSVTNCIVRIKLANNIVGIGAGAPIDYVTGETLDSCMHALAPEHLTWLHGQSIETLPALTRQIHTRLKHNPAAAAALDIALYDAYGKLCKLPIVDILGRVHHALPTSITIGIQEMQAAVLEAKDYVARGFKNLKIKLGEDVQQDIETVRVIREHFPREIKIRVDMNEGYGLDDLQSFIQNTNGFDIELIEQPFSRENFHLLAQFPKEVQKKIAADESMISITDAFHLVSEQQVCGIFNIKLMKCGGITPALQIARLANLGGIDLMWGCMDESIISITAALHAAFASAKTKYLDLDGSFDLAQDIVSGGFILENGCLRPLDLPGLGVV